MTVKLTADSSRSCVHLLALAVEAFSVLLHFLHKITETFQMPSALNVTRQQPDKWISAVESDSNFVLFPHVPTCLSDPFSPSFRRTVTIVSVTLLYAKVPQSHNILVVAGGCCLFSLAGAFRLRSSAGHFVSAFFIGCPWLEHTWYACCT